MGINFGIVFPSCEYERSIFVNFASCFGVAATQRRAFFARLVVIKGFSNRKGHKVGAERKKNFKNEFTGIKIFKTDNVKSCHVCHRIVINCWQLSAY